MKVSNNSSKFAKISAILLSGGILASWGSSLNDKTVVYAMLDCKKSKDNYDDFFPEGEKKPSIRQKHDSDSFVAWQRRTKRVKFILSQSENEEQSTSENKEQSTSENKEQSKSSKNEEQSTLENKEQSKSDDKEQSTSENKEQSKSDDKEQSTSENKEQSKSSKNEEQSKLDDKEKSTLNDGVSEKNPYSDTSALKKNIPETSIDNFLEGFWIYSSSITGISSFIASLKMKKKNKPSIYNKKQQN